MLLNELRQRGERIRLKRDVSVVERDVSVAEFTEQIAHRIEELQTTAVRTEGCAHLSATCGPVHPTTFEMGVELFKRRIEDVPELERIVVVVGVAKHGRSTICTRVGQRGAIKRVRCDDANRPEQERVSGLGFDVANQTFEICSRAFQDCNTANRRVLVERDVTTIGLDRIAIAT